MLVAFIRSGRGDARGSESARARWLFAALPYGASEERMGKTQRGCCLCGPGAVLAAFTGVWEREKHRKYSVCPNQICCHNLVARSFPGEGGSGSSSLRFHSLCDLLKLVSVRMLAGRALAAHSRASLCCSCHSPFSRMQASFQGGSSDLAGRVDAGAQESVWPAEPAGEAA